MLRGIIIIIVVLVQLRLSSSAPPRGLPPLQVPPARCPPVEERREEEGGCSFCFFATRADEEEDHASDSPSGSACPTTRTVGAAALRARIMKTAAKNRNHRRMTIVGRGDDLIRA